MKKNKLLLIMLSFVLMMVSMVLADSITLGNLTTAHGNVTIRGDNFPINVTINSHNITSCFLLASSATTNTSGSTTVDGSNRRGIEIGNMTLSNHYGSLPANISNFTMFVNTNSMLDANDYNISAFCSRTNGTNVSIYYANASIVIDNRVPPTPSALTSGRLLRKDKDFTFVATGDTDVRSCLLSFDGLSPISPPSCSIPVNGTNCSCVFNDAPYTTYGILIDFLDGQNMTRSARSEVTLSSAERQQGASGGIVITTTPEQAQDQPQSVSPVGQTTPPSGGGGIGQTIANFVRGLVQAVIGLFR